MKRILLGAVALITAIGSAAPLAQAAPGDWRRDNNQWERNHDGRHDRWDRNHDRNPYNNNYNNGRRWSRGDRIGHNDWNRFRDVDYRSYHLRPAPRGYRYVRDDRTGDVLLAAIATGLIVSVIANSR